MIAFDPYELRRQFPALGLTVGGRPAVFFDGAGYITGQVIKAEGGLMMWQGSIV